MPAWQRGGSWGLGTQVLGAVPRTLHYPWPQIGFSTCHCRRPLLEGLLCSGLELGVCMCDLINPHSHLRPRFGAREAEAASVAKGCTARQELSWEGPLCSCWIYSGH